MAPRLLAAIVVVLLALPTGCAMHSYAPTTAAATREVRIKVGEEVRVVTTRRERLSIRVTEVRSDRLVGVRSGQFADVTTDPFARPGEPRPPRKDPRPDGVPVEVPYDELAVIQVRRFDAGKAALVTAVVAVTVTAAAAIIHTAPPVGVFATPP